MTILVFAPALWNGFVNWDDYLNFLLNQYYRGLGIAQLRWMFTTAFTGHWIPLTWMTLGLDYLVWGMNPFGYHLTNLMLHAATATLFYFVALRLLRLAMTGVSETTRAWGAAAAALFFAIHPLRAESVAWVTERRDVLSGVFFMLTVLTYLAAGEGQRRAHRGWLWLSIGCYALALLSKSIVMPLPLILILLDVYPLGRLPGRWRDWLGPDARQLWKEKLPYFALAVAAGIVAVLGHRAADSLTPFTSAWFERAAIVMYGFAFYLRKTLVPIGLTPLYELPAQLRPLASRFVLSAVAVASLSGALWVLRRRVPGAFVSWIAYLLMLAPVSLGLHKGHQLVTDRYSYLSCLGFAILFGAAACVIGQARPRGRLGAWAGRSAVGTLAIWLAILGVLTSSQVRVWRDSDTLWRHAIAIDALCAICHSQLGSSLLERGFWEPAIEEFKRTLTLRPDIGRTKLALSFALLQAGRPAEAAGQARPVAREYPNADEPRVRLGAALVALGALEIGIDQLNLAIRLNPANPEAFTYLGIARTKLGRPTEAIADLRRAIELSPGAPHPHLSLARAYLAVGDVAAANEEIQIVRRLDPRLADHVPNETFGNGHGR